MMCTFRSFKSAGERVNVNFYHFEVEVIVKLCYSFFPHYSRLLEWKFCTYTWNFNMPVQMELESRSEGSPLSKTFQQAVQPGGSVLVHLTVP